MQDFFKKLRPEQKIEREILNLQNSGDAYGVKMIGYHFEQIKNTYPNATHIAYTELPENQKKEIQNLANVNGAFIIRANSSVLIKNIKEHIYRLENWNPELVRGGLTPLIAYYDGHYPAIVLDLLSNSKPLLIYVNQEGKLGMYQDNNFLFASDTFPEIMEKLIKEFPNFQESRPLNFDTEMMNNI